MEEKLCCVVCLVCCVSSLHERVCACVRETEKQVKRECFSGKKVGWCFEICSNLDFPSGQDKAKMCVCVRRSIADRVLKARG